MSSLQKVFVLTRHGERERLVKHSHKLQERGQDPPLSQGALLELSRLAAALRERYLLSPTCSLTSSCLGSVEEPTRPARHGPACVHQVPCAL
mmetsp:Transcript_28005/g.85518  ORF Transcript_28005/g.85518 Transcript_28005/m.85518 type:complete len:92 (-) Transcript_28005:1454-1729(-)